VSAALIDQAGEQVGCVCKSAAGIDRVVKRPGTTRTEERLGWPRGPDIAAVRARRDRKRRFGRPLNGRHMRDGDGRGSTPSERTVNAGVPADCAVRSGGRYAGRRNT
jgi:hypothetical protein